MSAAAPCPHHAHMHTLADPLFPFFAVLYDHVPQNNNFVVSPGPTSPPVLFVSYHHFQLFKMLKYQNFPGSYPVR